MPFSADRPLPSTGQLFLDVGNRGHFPLVDRDRMDWRKVGRQFGCDIKMRALYHSSASGNEYFVLMLPGRRWALCLDRRHCLLDVQVLKLTVENIGRIGLLLEQVTITCIAVRFQRFRRNKPQRRRVDTISPAGGRGPVRKYMTQMGIALPAAHFRAGHQQPPIGFFDNVARFQGF